MFDLKSTSFLKLQATRKDYLKTVSAPLDGMWEDGFFLTATHWNIVEDDRNLGYCAVNSESVLIGFQAFDPMQEARMFDHCLDRLGITQAYASSAEPSYLCLCMDRQTQMTVTALMYTDDETESPSVAFPQNMIFRPIGNGEHERAVEFGVSAIGAPRNWLEGYYAERIAKNELFGVWSNTDLLAAGELRLSPSQDGVADVGIIVGPAYRKKGLATLILRQLRHYGKQRGLRLICSTEQENEGAQKAIQRAGFHAYHRILKFDFK